MLRASHHGDSRNGYVIHLQEYEEISPLFDNDGMLARGVLSPASMAAADARALAAGNARGVLVERAALACLRVIRSRYPRRPVTVLSGPGSNGDDGLVLARMLLDVGWPVEVMRLDYTLPLDSSRHRGVEAVLRPTGSFSPDRQHLIVDALFGAGLSRPLAGESLRLIERTAASGAKVLAIDLPSGLDGTTGEACGFVARADASVTFHRLKPGHLVGAGPDLCGSVFLADIGLVPHQDDADALWNDPALWRDHMGHWSRETHKYQRGHVTVMGGPGLKGGAGRLAALAAARTGAGAVSLLSPLNAATFAASRLDAVMVGTLPDTEHLTAALTEKLGAVVIGPGMGHSAAAARRLDAVLASKLPVVLDADALTLHDQNTAHLFDRLHAGCVLTPHEGEFRRLFPDLVGDQLRRAAAAAERCGATVLLKGASTVIATPGQLPVIDTTGSLALATAGSGDSLAGIIAGALAQGHDPHRAASIGAWLHGKAGEGAGLSLMADMLAARVGDVFDALMASK